MRNKLIYDLWGELGDYSPRSRFVEVFLNQNPNTPFGMEHYRGVYLLMESIKRSPNRLDLTPLSPGDLTGYSKYLDVPSQIDYDVMRELSRNVDGASTFFSIDRSGKLKMGPLWDYNQALGLSSLGTALIGYGWQTAGWNLNYMRSSHWLSWWGRLDDDPRYQLAWNDRWVVLRKNSLSNAKLFEKIDQSAALLAEAQVRNFEKWKILGEVAWIANGRSRADAGETARDTYAKEVQYLRSWVADRAAWIDSQVPSPPRFNQSGGPVDSGFVLEMTPGTDFQSFTGDLFYTLDGSDPAEMGTFPSQYYTPINLSGLTQVKARTRQASGAWSSLRQETFLVGAIPPHPASLTLSKIQYHPRTFADLEFLEIANRGEFPINLTGVKLAGAVTFEFAPMILQPGEVVVVGDEIAFRAIFANPDSPRNVPGLVIVGQWTGRLNNAGETIELRDSEGILLHQVSYQNGGIWPPEANGQGFSLEIDDVLTDDPALAGNWRLSSYQDGTPGDLPGTNPFTSEVWQETFFSPAELNQPAISGELADPDDDGLPNLLEFAFASHPLEKNAENQISLLFENNQIDRNIKLTFLRPQGANLRYQLESSTDLNAWVPLPILPIEVNRDPESPVEGLTIQTDWDPSDRHRSFRIRVFR